MSPILGDQEEKQPQKRHKTLEAGDADLERLLKGGQKFDGIYLKGHPMGSLGFMEALLAEPSEPGDKPQRAELKKLIQEQREAIKTYTEKVAELLDMEACPEETQVNNIAMLEKRLHQVDVNKARDDAAQKFQERARAKAEAE